MKPMAISSDPESLEPTSADAAYSHALINRKDIFALEGNTSLRIIGALAFLIAIFSVIGLRVVPNYFIGDPASGSNDQSLAGSVAHAANGHLIPMQLELSESAVDFFLKADKSLLPKSKSKSKSNSKPKPKPNGSSPASVHPHLLMKATLPADSKQAVRNPVQAQDKIDDLARLGDDLKKHSDYAGARDAFHRALAQDPKNENVLSGMADLFRYSGTLDSAIGFYRASLAVNPNNPVTHNGLGTALYENSVRAMNNRFAKTHNIHDQAKYIKDQYDSALIEYGNAIAIDSTCVQAFTNRGVLYAIHNDPDAALNDYSRAIRIKPSNADAYSKRAETYTDIGKFDAAISDYSAAIHLDSASYEFDPTLHFANAYFGRGTAYYKMGKLNAAIADFDSTLSLSPRHSLAVLSKGVALADQRHYDSAITFYTRAISLLTPTEYNGAMMLAYLQRGNSWKALGKYDTAIVDYQSAISSPNLASKACWRIAECFCLKKDAATAITWLRKAKNFRNPEIKKWIRDGELSMLADLPEYKELIRE